MPPSPSRSLFSVSLPLALLTLAVPAAAVPTVSLTAPAAVNEGASFTLTGLASATEPGEVLTNYRYERISPDSLLLYDGVPKSTFGPIAAPLVGAAGGVQTYRLTVTSVNSRGVAQTAAATRAVVVRNVLVAPVANAGPNFATRVQRTTQLSGSGTDANGTITAYSWTQPVGQNVVLSNPALPNPTFVAPAAAGSLTFRLQVTDNDGQVSPLNAVVVKVQANSPPVVNAGPVSMTVNEGTLVTLNGTVTDANNDPLTYQWTKLTGPQAIVFNTPTAVDTTFTAPSVSAQETYTFRLAASDGLAEVVDTITVIVNSVNRAPVAQAGPDQGVVEGAVVTLNAAGSSDPDGDALTFSWAQTVGTAVTLSGGNGPGPTFTAPDVAAAGETLRFRVTVNDGHGQTAVDTVDILVQDGGSANRPPVVTAGPDQTVDAGATVTLDGVASDPNNDALTLQWTRDAGPRDLALTDSGTAHPSFTAPSPDADEIYVFRLTASDGALTAADTVSILVKAAAAPAAAASGLPLISDPRVYPSPFSPSAGGATIRYTLRSAADVTVRVSDIFGRQVRELRLNAGGPGGTAGDNNVPWDGRNGEGEAIGNGAYVVQIVARDGGGAQGKISDRVGVRR